MQDLIFQLHQYAAKGGKTSRRRTVARIQQMLSEIGKPPHCVSRGDVYRWIEGVEASSTRRDRYYSARLFWRLTYGSDLPKPRCLAASSC